MPDPDKHVLAHVFKITQDPYVGKMGVLRVHQGTITRDSQLYVGDGRRPFKVGHLFMLQGKELKEVAKAVPGDICAIAKVEELHFDAVLHDAAEDAHIHLKPLDFPVPVHGLAIEPKRRGDEQRLHDILQKLVSEDPCLRRGARRPAPTRPWSTAWASCTCARCWTRLTEVHSCQVETRPPRIAYRETVTRAGRGPPPPQEADRRRRPVRRGVPAHRAAAARRRLRVRRRGQGRRHPAQLHAGGGEGRAPGAWSRAWSPATRWWT